MRAIRKAIVEGAHLLSLAPKGQVSYSADTLPRIEGGTIHLGLDAAKRASPRPVIVLPVSFHRRYEKKTSLTRAKKSSTT
ncbi:MAG: hypothetical protein GW949_06655 [Spirochaetales bacterium]|nr:hypothetical protein [Spirochaetales bacterium]